MAQPHFAHLPSITIPNLSARSVWPGANDALASRQSRHQALLSRTRFSLSFMAFQAARAFGEEPFWSHSGMAPADPGPYQSRRRAASQSMIAMTNLPVYPCP